MSDNKASRTSFRSAKTGQAGKRVPHVLREQLVQLKENLTYEEIPVQIVDHKEQVLRSKVISLVKVLWRNHEREATTWEPEVQMRRQYPQLFSD